MTLSAARQEPSEEDDCNDVRIIASSDPSSIGEMVIPAVSSGRRVVDGYVRVGPNRWSRRGDVSIG